MTDFKAKMHQIRFRLGLCPRPHWESLQRSPRTPSWIWGRFAAGVGWAGEEEGKGGGESGGEGKGGPPSYCWTRAPQSLATPLLEIRARRHSRWLKWYHSIDCVSVTLSLKSTIFLDIRLRKCRELENWVMGLSKSLEISPFDRARTTSYWRSIVTMALSRIVSEIFNVEKCRELEIVVKGHSRSLKVVPLDRLCIVSY